MYTQLDYANTRRGLYVSIKEVNDVSGEIKESMAAAAAEATPLKSCKSIDLLNIQRYIGGGISSFLLRRSTQINKSTRKEDGSLRRSRSVNLAISYGKSSV